MKKIVLINIVILLAFSSNSSSQNWNIEDCIRYARKYRTEVKKSDLQDRYNAKSRKYTKYEMLPSVGLSLSHNLSWGKSLNPSEYKWEDSQKQNGTIRVFSELMLFNGLSLYYNRKEKKFVERRERVYKEKLRYDIGIEVIKNYFEVCIAKERMNIYKGFIQNSRERLKTIEILVDGGKLASLDKLEIKAQIEKDLSELGNVENAYNNAMYLLKKSMNLAKSEKLSLERNIIISSNKEYKADSIYRQIVKIIPDRYLLREDSLILKSRLNKTRSLYYPILSLQGELYSRYQNDIPDPVNPKGNYKYHSQINDNLYKQISLNLSIPIYNRHKVKSEILKNRLEQSQLKLDKANFFEQLYFSTENICEKTLQLKKNCSALKRQLNHYNEILRLRNIQYEKGKLSIIDLLTIIKERNATIINKKIEDYNLRYLEYLIKYYTTNIN